MSRQDKEIAGAATPAHSSSSEVVSFLQAAAAIDPTRSGRLVFALDATMSRQPTWERAMRIQSAMFSAVAQRGGLSVQLVYFRGLDECRASRWVVDAAALQHLMTGITCRGGQTQIGRILTHTRRETAREKVAALVFIGDAMEEDVDSLCRQAGELGLRGVRCFFFQDGVDPGTERAFREMARLSGGAWFLLGPDSASELAGLLAAVALYVQGGLKALSGSGSLEARRLLAELSG